jgi:hypothetical protein
MDLRSIANRVSSTVNPNIPATVTRSVGYTMGAGMKQIPTYAAPVSCTVQMQALDGKDLAQVDGLNIQGEIKSVFIRGLLSGVNQPNVTGGDMIQINGEKWLVVKVLEGWPTWTKAAIVLQDN